MANITDQQVASADSTEGTAPAWFDQGVDLRKPLDEKAGTSKSPELVWLEESATLARRGYIKALARSGSKDPAEVELEVLLEEQPKLRPWEHYIRAGPPPADGTTATDDAQARNAQPRPEGTHPPGGGEACGSASAHEDTRARQDRRLQEFEGMGGRLNPDTLCVTGTRGALPKLLEKEQQRGNRVMAGDRNALAKDIARALKRRLRREPADA